VRATDRSLTDRRGEARANDGVPAGAHISAPPKVASHGASTNPHVDASSSNSSSTAALPRSFALFESRWVSKPIRSIAASMLEFRSSTIRTSTTVAIRSTRSTAVTGSTSAEGTSVSAKGASSCRNAPSPVGEPQAGNGMEQRIDETAQPALSLVRAFSESAAVRSASPQTGLSLTSRAGSLPPRRRGCRLDSPRNGRPATRSLGANRGCVPTGRASRDSRSASLDTLAISTHRHWVGVIKRSHVAETVAGPRSSSDNCVPSILPESGVDNTSPALQGDV